METTPGWKMPFHWKVGLLLVGAGALVGAVKGPDWLSDEYSADTGFQSTLHDGTEVTALVDLRCGGARNDTARGIIHLVTERHGDETPGGRTISATIDTGGDDCDRARDGLRRDPAPLVRFIAGNVRRLPSDGSQDGDPETAEQYLSDYQDMVRPQTTPTAG
jgi:hypothetical protein